MTLEDALLILTLRILQTGERSMRGSLSGDRLLEIDNDLAGCHPQLLPRRLSSGIYSVSTRLAERFEQFS